MPSNTHSTATGHSRWAEDCEHWAALDSDSGDESMSVGVRTCLVSHNMDPQLGSPRPGGDSLHGRELKVFKILILGDSGTGKTALVRRSVHDFFTEGYSCMGKTCHHGISGFRIAVDTLVPASLDRQFSEPDIEASPQENPYLPPPR